MFSSVVEHFKNLGDFFKSKASVERKKSVEEFENEFMFGKKVGEMCIRMTTLQLIHGDCLEMMKTLLDKSIDLFVCDLPYGCLTNKPHADGSEGKSKGGLKHTAKTGCAWDIPIDLTEFWVQVERLMKDDHTPIIHFCNTRFGFELMKSKPDWFRYDLVWNKMHGVSFLQANKMPMRSHENIYVFAKKGATYYRKDIEGDFPAQSSGRGNVAQERPTREGVRCVKSVINISNKKGKGNHPTQKPAELYQWLIERYSKEGDTILDPTAGSFTSVFTAHKLNRNGIGIEKDDEFFKKAEQNNSSI
jgi:site-specific DNA-methyltransferase (adenine-specific)